MAMGLKYIALFIGVLCIYVLSVILRYDVFTLSAGSESLEATFHALWTMLSLTSSTANAHYYLPTVTLNPGSEYLISWGATIPTQQGSHIYTSFGPLGFLIPMALFELFSTNISFFNLSLFNSVLGFLCAVAIAAFCGHIAKDLTRDKNAFAQVFVIIAILYLFTSESLISHGAVYWPHSLSQFVFILASWAFYGFVKNQQGKTSGLFILLLILCFIFPQLEWTGYVFNAGLVLALTYQHHLDVYSDKVSLRYLLRAFISCKANFFIILATVLSGVLFLAHYIYALGIENMFVGLLSRAFARGFTHQSSLEYLFLLPYHYVLSSGLLILTIPWMLRATLWKKITLPRHVWLCLFVTLFPLLENLIMLNHASQFSFDRLKLIVPLVIMLTLYLTQPNTKRPQYTLFVLIFFILASNISLFFWRQQQHHSWVDIAQHNQKLKQHLIDSPYRNCSIYGHNLNTRGYLNFLFKRDIFERAHIQELTNKLTTEGCLVFIETKVHFTDLPHILSIKAYNKSNERLFEIY